MKAENKPLISVVVPTRNRVDWLRRCLDGIVEQDFPDYEVVIVDDGSCEEVVLAYQKMMDEFGSRFRFLRLRWFGVQVDPHH